MGTVTCAKIYDDHHLYTGLKELNLELQELRSKRDEISSIIADTYDNPELEAMVNCDDLIREQAGVVRAINDILLMKADILDQLMSRKGV